MQQNSMRERERGECMSEYQKCKRGQRQGCCEAYEEKCDCLWHSSRLYWRILRIPKVSLELQRKSSPCLTNSLSLSLSLSLILILFDLIFLGLVKCSVFCTLKGGLFFLSYAFSIWILCFVYENAHELNIYWHLSLI